MYSAGLSGFFCAFPAGAWIETKGINMAITVTPVLAGTTKFIADITADADADTVTGNIAHGLGAIPLSACGIQLLSQALTALSAWALTTLDATNLELTKLASAGSGNAAKQYRVEVSLPHSIVK